MTLVYLEYCKAQWTWLLHLQALRNTFIFIFNFSLFICLYEPIGCYPVWSSNKRVSRIFFMIYGRDAKVAQFHGSILGQQQVACFHVAMYHKAFVMQKRERLECFTNDVFYLRLS